MKAALSSLRCHTLSSLSAHPLCYISALVFQTSSRERLAAVSVVPTIHHSKIQISFKWSTSCTQTLKSPIGPGEFSFRYSQLADQHMIPNRVSSAYEWIYRTPHFWNIPPFVQSSIALGMVGWI